MELHQRKRGQRSIFIPFHVFEQLPNRDFIPSLSHCQYLITHRRIQ